MYQATRILVLEGLLCDHAKLTSMERIVLDCVYVQGMSLQETAHYLTLEETKDHVVERLLLTGLRTLDLSR